MADVPLRNRACQCGGIGWLCAATNKPADFEHGTCCNPTECEEFTLGPGCPSANGCPDCDWDWDDGGGPDAANPCWDLTT